MSRRWYASLFEAFLTHFSSALHCFTPWKHQKTFRLSDVFRGYGNATLGWNGLTSLEASQSDVINIWVLIFHYCISRLGVKWLNWKYIWYPQLMLCRDIFFLDINLSRWWFYVNILVFCWYLLVYFKLILVNFFYQALTAVLPKILNSKLYILRVESRGMWGYDPYTSER